MIITLLKVYLLIGCITTIIEDLIWRYVGAETNMILEKIILWPINLYAAYVAIKRTKIENKESK